MSVNGVHLLQKSPIGAARGFFDLFYRLNTSSSYCIASTSTSRARGQIKPKVSSSFHNTRRSHSTTSSPPTSPSQPTSTPEPPLSTTLRHLMRHLPHSVVVLTTSTSPTLTPNTKSSSNPPHKPKHGRKGMTLSSFTTLTLTPTPIITFNIRKPSQTLSTLMETRSFLIHILNGNLEGARVADRFTKGNTKELWEGLNVEDIDVGEGVVCPRILNGGGKAVGRVLVCEVEGGKDGNGFVEVGDHVVVVAGVRGILGEGGEIDGEGEYGLCYVDGKYRSVGGVIDVKSKS